MWNQFYLFGNIAHQQVKKVGLDRVDYSSPLRVAIAGWHFEAVNYRLFYAPVHRYLVPTLLIFAFSKLHTKLHHLISGCLRLRLQTLVWVSGSYLADNYSTRSTLYSFLWFLESEFPRKFSFCARLAIKVDYAFCYDTETLKSWIILSIILRAGPAISNAIKQ